MKPTGETRAAPLSGASAAPAGAQSDARGKASEATAIRRGIGAAWLNVAAGLVAAPLQTAMLVRWLSPEDAGFWLIVLSFTGYLALFDLGMGPTLTRTVALLKGRIGSAEAGGELSGTIGTASLGDIVATARALYGVLATTQLTVMLFAGPLPLTWAADRPFAGSDALTWALFAIGGAITLVGGFPYAALAGEGIVGLGQVARAVAQLTGLAGTFTALMLSHGVVGVAVAWVVQSVVFTAAGVYFYWRLAPHDRWRGEVRRALVPGLLGPSLRWTWMSLGSVALFSGGTVLVSRFLGAAAVPSYATLLQLVASLRNVSLIPMNAVTPFISRAFGAADLVVVREHLLRSLRHTAVPLFAGVALLSAFADDLIGVWVGSTHFAGWAAVWVFVMGALVETHCTIHATTVMATGRLVFVPWTLAAAAIGLAAATLLVPTYGVVGMVIAWAGAQAITMGWFAPWYSVTRFALSWRAYGAAMRPLGLLLLGVFASAGGARAGLYAFGIPAGLPRLALGALVLGTALLPWVWVLALDQAERRRVMTAVRWVTRRRR